MFLCLVSFPFSFFLSLSSSSYFFFLFSFIVSRPSCFVSLFLSSSFSIFSIDISFCRTLYPFSLPVHLSPPLLFHFLFFLAFSLFRNFSRLPLSPIVFSSLSLHHNFSCLPFLLVLSLPLPNLTYLTFIFHNFFYRHYSFSPSFVLLPLFPPPLSHLFFRLQILLPLPFSIPYSPFLFGSPHFLLSQFPLSRSHVRKLRRKGRRRRREKNE